MSCDLNGDCSEYQLSITREQQKKQNFALSARDASSQDGGTPSFDTLRRSPELVPPQILQKIDIKEEKVIDDEAKAKLQKILGSLLNMKNNEKLWLNFEDFQEKQQQIEEDPTPDFVEGVFFVSTRDWYSILRCRKWQPGLKICVYDARSLFVFDHKSWFRQRVVSFTESNEFQNFTILIILLGTLTLIIYDYQDRSSVNTFNQSLDKINTYSTYFYLFEFAMKIVTQGGFRHPNSYFKDAWNWLDFLVVIAGVTELTSLPNFPVKALRAFRVLRPLRSIRQFPRLRKLIQGLTSSIPPLTNALSFLLFVFFQLSVFGSQQFGAAYYNRCRLPGNVQDGAWIIDSSQPRLCSKDDSGYQCINGAICGEPSDVGLDFRDDDQYVKMSIGDYGITSFINPFVGVITIFQCITLEGWSTIMYNFMDNQNSGIVVTFFILVVIVGAFFLINLVLAVIGQSLDQTDGIELENSNKSKQSIAFSLLRKAKNLSIEERQKFLEQLKMQEFQRDSQVMDQTSQNVDLLGASTKLQISAILPLSQINQDSTIKAATLNLTTNLLPAIEQEQTPAQLRLPEVKPIEELQVLSEKNADEIREQHSDLPSRAKTNFLYRYCFRICSSPVFQITFTLIIIANALSMTLDRFPQPKKRVNTLDTFNQVCSWLFTGEMIIKLIGIGPVQYARDRFNLFDSFIVVMSLIENVTFYVSGNKIGSGIIVLRSFRLLRIFKLARSWTSFRTLLAKIIDTLPNVISFSFLQLIFLSVFIILGMQFFAGTVYLDQKDQIVSKGTPPLNNFENLYNATVSVLGVMMIDGWPNTMFQYCRVLGVPAQIYFIAAILVLNIILLNLFLAIILENFGLSADSEDLDAEEEQKGLKNLQLKLSRAIKMFQQRIPCIGQKLGTVLVYLEPSEAVRPEQESQQELAPSQEQIKKLEDDRVPGRSKNVSDEVAKERRKSLSVAQTVRNATTIYAVKSKIRKRTEITGTSLVVLSPDNSIRRLCAWILDLRHFDTFSNVMVVFSTVLLAIDNPLDDPNSHKQVLLTSLDYFTTTIFSLESIIKIVVFGLLFNGKRSYLRIPWNILDFLVVLVSLFSYLPLGTDLQFYKSMRLLRILRPLRMIQRNKGLKLAIKSLVNVVPAVINLLFISVINLGLLAVLGLNIFKGTFFTCDMTNIPISHQNQIRNMWDCQDYGGQWTNANQNFDNFFNAYYTVYQISTTDNWLGIASFAQQKTEIFQMPRSMSSPITILYFIIVILLQSLFMVNLFVGVVLATYEKEIEKQSNNTYLTTLESEYIDSCIKCYRIKPEKVFSSPNILRRICYSITEHQLFKRFMFLCILVNTVMLGCTWYGMSPTTNTNIDRVNIALIAAYSVEVVLKLCALGRIYFVQGWNMLDILIVILGLIGYLVQFINGTNYTLSLTVIRAFKVSSVLRMIRRFQTLKEICMTFIDSLGDILNIGLLLCLFLFMFVILAINLFSGVKLQTYLNEDVNFRSFGVAFLSMFRAYTGEDFADLMADLARQQTIVFRCKQNQSYEDIQRDGFLGCGSQLSNIFFPIFQLFMSFIMMNLFVAVILQGYNNEILTDHHKLQLDTLKTFQLFWQKYDPGASGLIMVDDLENLILDLTYEEIRYEKNKNQKHSEVVLFNFSRKRLFQLSAYWRKKEDDGSREYKRLLSAKSFQKQLKKHLEKFIGDLQIPTYNKGLQFNFHDVLISFVDFLFTQCHLQEYQKRQTLIQTLRATGQQLEKLDRIEPFSQEYFKLSRQDQQQLVEQSSKHFVNVIHSIEEKGQNLERKIEKLAVLQDLRSKIAKQNSEKLDNFGDYILCSKRIAAIKLIKRMLQKRKKHLAIVSAQIPNVPNQNRNESSQARLVMNESDEIDFNLRTHVVGLTTFNYRSKSQTIQLQQNVESFSDAMLHQHRSKDQTDLVLMESGLPAEPRNEEIELIVLPQPLKILIDKNSSDLVTKNLEDPSQVQEGAPDLFEKREQGRLLLVTENDDDRVVDCSDSFSGNLEHVISTKQLERSRQAALLLATTRKVPEATLNDSEQDLLFFPSIEYDSSQPAQVQQQKYNSDNFTQTEHPDHGSGAFVLVSPFKRSKPQKIQADFKGTWVSQSQEATKVQNQKNNHQTQAQRPMHQGNTTFVSTSFPTKVNARSPFSSLKKLNV